METLRFLMISTHFPPYHLGGDAVFVDYLSEELASKGHEVHVLHNPSVYDFIRKKKTNVSGHTNSRVNRHIYGSYSKRIEIVASLVAGASGRAERAAADLVSRTRPDVVHWHNTRGFICRPFRFGDEVSLYTSHDYGSVCPRSNLLRPNLEICEHARLCTMCCTRWGKPPQLWRTFSKRVIEYPDDMKIISPSEFMASRLRMEGVRVTHVLRNFVPDPGARNLDRNDDHDSVVYLGMLELHKGLVTLVKAFTESSDQQGFSLDIIGEGSLKNKLMRMVSESGVAERVHFHGFLERGLAESLRSRAAAQIVPSEWYENCPLTILEALSSGVPVIGSDTGGIPEIVNQEAGSSLFECGSSESLANALVDSWNGRDSLSTLRKKARVAYESRFKPSAHVREYLKTIDESG